MMCIMSDYSVAVTFTTDVRLGDDQIHDAVQRACWDAGLELAMTSTGRDDPWLRIAARTQPVPDGTPDRSVNDAADVVSNMVAALGDALRDRGATITEWVAIEVVSEHEQMRRGRHRAIPPMVNAAELAELAGVTVQRIYQYESDRKAGRGTFPAPALDGYWLRAVAEHWAKYRKTKPGPAPMTVDEAFTAAGKASKRIAQERRARE